MPEQLPEVNVAVFATLIATIIPVTIAQQPTPESGIVRTQA